MHIRSSSRPLARLRARRRLAALGAFGALACGSSLALAGPQPSPPMRPAAASTSIDQIVADASRRFAVPTNWIVEVMSVESRRRVDALSPKGAIGLMQVMPDTYADMRARYGLGPNPWDPRDNVLAGTAYLRLLFERYGAPGFLVAYNAGPGRWDDYRLRARPLPAETVAYLARLGPVVGGCMLPMPTFAGWSAPRSPLPSPIFVRLASASAAVPMSRERERIVRIIDANTSVVRPAFAIFVTPSRSAEASSTERSDGSSGADPVSPSSTPGVPSTSPGTARNPLFPDRTNAGSSQ